MHGRKVRKLGSEDLGVVHAISAVGRIILFVNPGSRDLAKLLCVNERPRQKG